MEDLAERDYAFGTFGQMVEESMVKIELLTFFHNNPYTMDSANGLSRRIHRPLIGVQAAAAALARVGVLEQMGPEPYLVYRLRYGNEITTFLDRSGKL